MAIVQSRYDRIVPPTKAIWLVIDHLPGHDQDALEKLEAMRQALEAEIKSKALENLEDERYHRFPTTRSGIVETGKVRIFVEQT